MPLTPESEALWSEAFARCDVSGIMARLGDHWQKSSDPCPFCQARHKFAVFKKGRQYFKCHAPGCVANTPDTGNDQVGYLALKHGLSRKDACTEFLRLVVPDLLPASQPTPPEPEKPARPHAETAPDDNPWHALWKRLILTAEDRAKLRNQRGFDDATIDLLGFRSNNEHNREHLLALLETYKLDLLLAEGIFKAKKFRDPEPSGQFLGWGRTGKKDDQGDEIWDITNPILIPYFDHNTGLPYYLRPHKGGVRKPQDPFAETAGEDDDDPEERPCAAHIYVPPGTAELVARNDGRCLWTEGEFKAGVGPQCRLPIIATPGTSFLKNANFRRRVFALLDELGVEHLVVIYDNEAKDDPQFSNYKNDPFDRYDVQVWAEYAQIVLKPHLRRNGGDCRIGWLPDEEREKGKADFDSILARHVRRDGPLAGTSRARRIFLQAADDATEPSQFRELFPSVSRRIIEWKLKRKFYQPRLLIGGDKEINLADQFNELDEGGHPIDRDLAAAFRDVVGCYYKRASVSKEARGEILTLLDTIKERLEELKALTTDIRDKRLRAVMTKRDSLYQKLKGVPERVSNFTLRCDYRLHIEDSSVVRLVRIIDSKDLKRKDHILTRLTAADLCGLRNFREWALATGDAVWHGGEKDLQNLSEDLDHQAYMRDIHEIKRIGYDEKSRIWFFGDKAYPPSEKKGEESTPIYPDDKGIFWHDGLGYQIDATANENNTTGFIQGIPFMTHPQGKVKPLDGPALAELGGVQGLFKSLAEFMFDNIGGYDGWVALGTALAYGIAPELLKFGGEGHPSAWFFGKLGEGKSFVMRLLMRIWGFRELEGILLNVTLSDVALSRILCQYSNLPLYLDEARRDTLTDNKLAIVRATYQRQSVAKGMADASIRVRGLVPATTPMVGGESSSHDGATRSRFAHINVAASRRLGDYKLRKDRILREAPHYYRIGDWLLSNRARFAELATEQLRNWIGMEEVRAAITDDRLRFVHGVTFACMQAAAILLEIPESSDGQFDPTPENDSDPRPRLLSEFHKFLLTYAEQAMRDVRDETFLVRFWEDVRAGVASGAISRKFFECFHLSRKDTGKYGYLRKGPYIAPDSKSFPALLISIKDVFPAYEIEYRKRTGQAPPLSMADIRRSLEREPYYIVPEKGNTVHRPKDPTKDNERGSYWAVSLEHTIDPDDEDETRVWKFPHAEAFLTAIHSKNDNPH